MYLSPFTTMSDRAEIEALVREVAVATVVTVNSQGRPEATLLPVLWQGDRLIAHAARANPQFHDLADGSAGLAVITGPDAYVSPNWYATKAKAGRAVPTWNYLSVQLSGPIRLHRDPDWLRATVTDLAVHHEQGRDPAWTTDEAPDILLNGLLMGIVGIEMEVVTVEAKAKLSQNRVIADRLSVIAGLSEQGDPGSVGVADAMRAREAVRTARHVSTRAVPGRPSDGVDGSTQN